METQDNKQKLSDRYIPQDVEQKMYQWWESQGYFKAHDQSTKPPYAIILPPPNVTGHLHMGHALDHTLQDILTRWKRMSGFNALWLPGTDHAGIATQGVVEKQLKKEGLTRHKLGREKFIERVWQWKHQYGDRICSQMRRLGDSVDWERNTFTLDDNVSKAVRKVFVSLHKKGWIYRGQKLINWSTSLETAISDLEVEYKEIKGSFWHIDYPIKGSQEVMTVSTTRPETLLGDTAIAVHPEDTRYKHLVGQQVSLPLTNRMIPIIADESVDKEFGSGIVKITPAHDFNDYEVGKRHHLPLINILEKNGLLNDNAGPYKGLTVSEARKKVVEDLREKGLLRSIEDHTHSVGHCSRSGCVVEPFLSEQWFVKAAEISIPARRVVESGTLRFEPESWTKTYLHWMNIIEDWCISRQLWWGHRIPAWYCHECKHITVSESEVTVCEKCQSKNLHQDEDVLDTWFSSALWPFSTMGWPKDTETQKTFYPTDVLVTGHDIIFFWVARMIMMGLEFKKDVPFRTVYIHGLVRDEHGVKMSKSTGNSVDPVEMIEKYGTDALRFTLATQIASGRDLKFSEKRLEVARNFMNKIWNATRFVLGILEGTDLAAGASGSAASGSAASGFAAASPSALVSDPALLPKEHDLSSYDKWIIYRLEQVEKEVEDHLDNLRFSEASNALYSFTWYDFCDWYLEFSKALLYGDGSASEKKATQLILAHVLNRVIRLLHPFIPFITEEIYQKLPLRSEALIIAEYPTVQKDRALLQLGNKQAAMETEIVKEVITALRNIRGENRIKAGDKIVARLAPSDGNIQKILGNNKKQIMNLARLTDCQIGEEGSLSKCAVTPIIIADVHIKVIVPLEGLVDFNEEIKRINKTIEKFEKDISLLTRKLDNANYIQNAPPDVVEADRKLLDEHKQKVVSLRESLLRLG